MIWNHDRFQGQELAEQGILSRLLPVDPAQDVWGDADGHRGGRHTVKDVLDELFAGLQLGAAAVDWHMVWQHGVQELDQLCVALNRICNLRSVNELCLEDNGSKKAPDLHPNGRTGSPWHAYRPRLRSSSRTRHSGRWKPGKCHCCLRR